MRRAILFLLLITVSLSVNFYTLTNVVGSFDGEYLTITYQYSVFNYSKVYLFIPNDCLELYDYSPKVPLFLDNTGVFLYTNESGEIRVKIRVKCPTKFEIPAPVLKADINGEIKTGYNPSFYLYSGTPKKESLIKNVRLIYNLETKYFKYFFDVKPGDTEICFEKKNGESINQIVGAEMTRNNKEFCFVPNQEKVIITGYFTSNKITPIYSPCKVGFEFGNEYYVQINLYGKGYAISPEEVGISTGFAYFYQDGYFEYSMEKLKTFPALVFSIDYCDFVGYYSEKGTFLSKLYCSFKNSGQEYAEISFKNKPIYLDVDGQRRKVTKKDNKLFFQLPITNYGRFKVYFLGKEKKIWPISIIKIVGEKPDIVVTKYNMKLYFPEKYYIVRWEGVINFLKTLLIPIVIFSIICVGLRFDVFKGVSLAILFMIYHPLAYITLLYLLYLRRKIIFEFLNKLLEKAGKILLLILAVIGIMALIIIGFIFFKSFGRVATVRYAAKTALEVEKGMPSPLAAEKKVEEIEGYVTREEFIPVEPEIPTSLTYYSKSYKVLLEKPEVRIFLIRKELIILLGLVLSLGLFVMKGLPSEK